MKIKEMVAQWLKDNGYDGLMFTERTGLTNCHCILPDIMTCSVFYDKCLPFKKELEE